MRDNNGARVSEWIVVGERAKDVHLSYGITIREDAVKVS